MENNDKILQKMEDNNLREDFEAFISKSEKSLNKANDRFKKTARLGAITSMLPLVGINALYVADAIGELNPMLGLSALALGGTVVLGTGLIGHSSKESDLKDLKDFSKIENEFYKEYKTKIKSEDVEKYNQVKKLELETSKGLTGAIKRAVHSFSNEKKKKDISLELVNESQIEVKSQKINKKGTNLSFN